MELKDIKAKLGGVKDEKPEGMGIMYNIAAFIVDYRKLLLVFFGLAFIYCLLSISRVRVNNDLTSYLSKDTETRQGLDIMNDQFTTFGSANVMLLNVDYDTALSIKHKMEDIKGISTVDFFDSTAKDADPEQRADTYHDFAAFYTLSFDEEEKTELSQEAMSKLRELVKPYDSYIYSTVDKDDAATLKEDMKLILVIVVLIIIGVLIFTSTTYMEIVVFMLTFLVAIVLNMGTNYLFEEVSFVTNAVGVVLQIALAIDYAIILFHRFMEEHEKLETRPALILALSKAIPEISSSSLTTMAGMAALMTMQFGIGMDLGRVLLKSIIFSMLAVFAFMPAMIMIFEKGIMATMHKSFVPKISFWGRTVLKIRYFLIPLFLLLIIGGFYYSNDCPYIYDSNSILTGRLNEYLTSKVEMGRYFNLTNTMAIVVPAGDYQSEAKVLAEVAGCEGVDMTLGLANVVVDEDQGFVLTDSLSPMQFSEVAGIDVDIARLLYTFYAWRNDQYGAFLSGLDKYRIPVIDMMDFIYDQAENGGLDLNEDASEEIENLHKSIDDARKQLEGDKYNRLIFRWNRPLEGESTFKEIDEIRDIALKYYDEVYVVGDSTSDYDLSKSFVSDNLKITIITALLVGIILLFTFKNAGLPFLLVLTIQGSIWVNFSIPTLTGEPMFFLSYLIVSSIQMGATIDYAIVITSRYLDLRDKMDDRQDAIVQTLNEAFPTVVTSGGIMACAAFAIGQFTSNGTIASLGSTLAKGVLISIAMVMAILPALLYIFDGFIDITGFGKGSDDRINELKRLRERAQAARRKLTPSGAAPEAKADTANAAAKKRLPATSLTMMIFMAIFSVSVTAAFLCPAMTMTAEASNYKDPEKTEDAEDAEDIADKEDTADTTNIEDTDKNGNVPVDGEDEEIPVDVYIRDPEALLELSKHAINEIYTYGKVFSLENDIDMTGVEFAPIPVFSGTFLGNGHTISGLSFENVGTDVGLFHFIGKNGLVDALTVKGDIRPEGERTVIGAIAGVNNGIISNCKFNGYIEGVSCVGGIAGVNDQYGTIYGCINYGSILGTSRIGGIAGENRGLIQDCTNAGGINSNGATVDAGEVDLSGSIELEPGVEDANKVRYIGGVAGYSSGTLAENENKGTVGFPHTGYQVGGVCGYNLGYMAGCSNSGSVSGRTDVGGIAGKLEPFVEIVYSGDIFSELEERNDRLKSGIDALSGTIKNAGSTLESDADSIQLQLKELRSSIREYLKFYENKSNLIADETNSQLDNLQKFMDSEMHYDVDTGNLLKELDKLGSDSQELSDYLKELNKQLNQNSVGILDQISEILGTVGDKSGKVVEDAGASAKELRSVMEDADKEFDKFQGDMQEVSGRVRMLREFQKTQEEVLREDWKGTQADLEKRGDDLGGSFDDSYSHIKAIRNDVNDRADNVISRAHALSDSVFSASDRGRNRLNKKELYTDVSDEADIAEGYSRIFASSNTGTITADINGGGIVGSMYIDKKKLSDMDVEESGTRTLNAEVEVTALVADCKNLGRINVKNDYAGGIAGRSDQGALNYCENYGDVSSEVGKYAGGIAGSSLYMVRGNYSLCIVDAQDYAGGITGRGTNIYDNVAMASSFTSKGDKRGVISGDVYDEHDAAGNLYVEEGQGAVNNVTYMDEAASLEYAELMELPGIPGEFSGFNIEFEADGEIVKNMTLKYGTVLEEKDCPDIPAKEGYYSWWDAEGLDFVNRNRIIHAQYMDYSTSFTANAGYRTENEGPLQAMMGGDFYPDASLEISEITPEAGDIPAGYTLLSAYEYNIDTGSTPDMESIELRLREDSLKGNYAGIRYGDSGEFTLMEPQRVDSYLKLHVSETGGQILILRKKDSSPVILMAAVILAAAGAAIFKVMHGKKRDLDVKYRDTEQINPDEQ